MYVYNTVPRSFVVSPHPATTLLHLPFSMLCELVTAVTCHFLETCSVDRQSEKLPQHLLFIQCRTRDYAGQTPPPVVMRPPRSHTQYKFHYPSQWRPKEISKPSLSPSLLSSRYNLNNTCLSQESFSRITTRKFRLCRLPLNLTIIPHTSRFQLARLSSSNTVILVWTGKTHSSLSFTELYIPTRHLRRAVLPLSRVPGSACLEV